MLGRPRICEKDSHFEDKSQVAAKTGETERVGVGG